MDAVGTRVAVSKHTIHLTVFEFVLTTLLRQPESSLSLGRVIFLLDCFVFYVYFGAMPLPAAVSINQTILIFALSVPVDPYLSLLVPVNDSVSHCWT